MDESIAFLEELNRKMKKPGLGSGFELPGLSPELKQVADSGVSAIQEKSDAAKKELEQTTGEAARVASTTSKVARPSWDDYEKLKGDLKKEDGYSANDIIASALMTAVPALLGGSVGGLGGAAAGAQGGAQGTQAFIKMKEDASEKKKKQAVDEFGLRMKLADAQADEEVKRLQIALKPYELKAQLGIKLSDAEQEHVGRIIDRMMNVSGQQQIQDDKQTFEAPKQEAEVKKIEAETGLAKAKTSATKAKASGGGAGGGKQLSQSTAQTLSNANYAVEQLNSLQKIVDVNKDIFDPTMGRLAGAAATFEIGELGKRGAKLEAEMGSIAQEIGRYLEGGKLAEGDIGRYKKMLPRLGDSAETVKSKIDSLRQKIAAKQAAELKALKGAGYNTAGIEQAQGGGKTPVRKQYSPSRNKTKVTYSDGSEEIFDGKQ